MQADVEDSLLRRFDPHQNYLWKWLPSRGRSGGLLCGIDINLYDVGSFKDGKYMLQLNLWDKTNKIKWNFINVYGAAQEENKNEFLAEFASFCNNMSEPYLIGGDFNIIRCASEKK